ncbi:outer membrane beta-barrel protein [Flammeovirgaceae bacterium SG7u.111]|nr:outer membrane beta-barrel protein [Flammeovirgaceae bacterium SG7u.132]WPO36624.1 outer membrane beta-barrel protein [Flammeovirgaceae bacterium SG7u.111]
MKYSYKIIIGLAMLMVSAQLTNAQDAVYTKFMIGNSSPFADFASNDEKKGGYALSGLGMGLEGVAFFDWIGLGGGVYYNLHSYDNATFIKQFNNQFPNAGELTFDAKKYKAWTFLVGPYAKANISDKFKLIGKLKIGAMTAIAPETYIKLDPPFGDPEELNIKYGKGTDVAFNGGIELMYLINDAFGVSFNVEATHSSPKYEFWRNNPSTGFFEPVELEQKISFVNIGLGFNFIVE